jgi:hypothetical protein
MVAYSFKPRFAEPIQSGLKRQTIRSERKRHATVGERLQLFTGMRTRQCTKIIADPICTNVRPIMIQWSNGSLDSVCVLPQTLGRGDKIEAFQPWGDFAKPDATFDNFARYDGFRNCADMAAFLEAEYGSGPNEFIGVLIEWSAS